MSVLLQILSVLAFLALTVGTAFFVAAEFSLAALERSTVSTRAASGDGRDRMVQTAHDRLSFELSACQVGITITTLITGYLAEPLIARLLSPLVGALGVPDSATGAISLVLALVLASYLSMVIGELVPKNLAIAHPVATARVVAGPLVAFSTATGLLVRFLDDSANRIVRRLGLEPADESAARSSSELGAVVRNSAREGSLARDTAVILERSLRFGDLSAEDIMTPRSTVATLDVDDTVTDLLALARETGYSRFPVIRHDLDDTRGVVHVKQALAIDEEQHASVPLSGLVRPIVRVPASLDGDSVLETIRREGSQVLLVVDEYDGAAGLITLEDVVEEIVGSVTDEYDDDEEQDVIRRGPYWEISGLLRTDEVAHHVGYQAPEGPYETVAGLVVKVLGRLPVVGDVVALPGQDHTFADEFASANFGTWEAEVLTLDGRRIDRLALRTVPRGQDGEAPVTDVPPSGQSGSHEVTP